MLKVPVDCTKCGLSTTSEMGLADVPTPNGTFKVESVSLEVRCPNCNGISELTYYRKDLTGAYENE